MTLATPNPRTWVDQGGSASLIRAGILNTELRDSLTFLVSGCQTTVALTANQSIPNNIDTPIVWDSELEDEDDLITVPASTFTFIRGGLVGVRAYITYAQSSSGPYRRLLLRYTPLGGSETDVAGVGDSPGSNNAGVSLATALPVSAGDSIRLYARQNAGSLDIIGGQSFCTVNWVGGWTPDPEPPPGPNPTKHTKSYQATWTCSYDDQDQDFGDATFCYQGYKNRTRGNTRSLIGFDSATLVNDLRGSTNVSMSLRFYTLFSESSSGLTAVVGGHVSASKPSSWHNSDVDQDLMEVHAAKERWTVVTLNSVLVKKLQSGSYKGISFGPGPTTSQSRYYGIFSGGTRNDRPVLDVTYWK